jgi:Acyl-CoA synthetases (AMP-forming)/AMP-acid ligases II
MDFNLNLKALLWRMEKLYKEKEIVSRTFEGRERYTYGQLTSEVRKLANMLRGEGEVVGSMAWNTRRHLEMYLAVPLLGKVLHTINVRFHPREVDYVVETAGDTVLFYDQDLEGTISSLSTKVRKVALDERWDNQVDSWDELNTLPEVEERRGAILCFTSGTTGRPKGVVYSHRSIFIHSLALLAGDVMGITSKDVVMPAVPMFHISAWDVPFASLMTGAKLVLPGPRPGPKELADLIQEEKVTMAVGAPTVWISFLDYVKRERVDLSSLKLIVTGGAEPPVSLLKGFRELGVKTYHAWGMTETEAITTINSSQEPEEFRKQGAPMPGVEFDVISPPGSSLPWDGRTSGELVVRGAWVTGGYFKDEAKSKESTIHNLEGLWFRTGDVVTIDARGNVKVVDRYKDLIKSGGEWISSVDLENAIMEYEPILEAVVVGVPDEKWGERPVALVVPKAEFRGKLKEDDVKRHLESLNRFPKWWIPDRVIFVDAIPKTSTGKMDKKEIRASINRLRE